MKRPTAEQMIFAMEWLEINEGPEGEADGCKAVAKWLEYQVQKADEREIAAQNGVSVSTLRRVMKTPAGRNALQSERAKGG